MRHQFARVSLFLYLFSHNLFASEMPYELKPSAPDEEISYFNMLWAQEIPMEVIKSDVQEVDREDGSPIGEEIWFFKILSKETQTSCGYLSYYILGQQVLLDALFLEKSYRRRGIGEQMLRQWESKLKQDGFISVSLTVLEENEAGIRLYKKLGYQIELLGEGTRKVCVMKKTL